MKKLARTILIIIFSYSAFAQNQEAFKIDSLPKEGILLDKGWKFYPDDKPEFAKADFDDSAWEGIDPTKDITSLPQIKKSKIGYLRLNFMVDSSLIGKALAFEIDQTVASEIYLNNILVHKLGVVSENINEEQILLPNGQPFSIIINKTGKQTLCVRYSFSNPPILLKHKPKKYALFSTRLTIIDNTIKDLVKDKNDYALVNYLKVGLFLFLFLIHIFFFISYQQQKANLYISLYALCNVLIFHFENLISNLPLSGHDLFINTSWMIILSILIGVFTLLIVYSYLLQPKKIMFWLIVVLIIAYYPVNIYAPDFGIFYINLLITGLLAFESIRLSIKTIGKGKTGAWYIFAGYVLYIIFLAIWYMIAFHILPFSEFGITLFANLCLTSVPICFSLMLASEYTQTNKTLAQKLNEVEALYVEKQKILSTQNETLETLVNERTAELKASQAQLIQSEKLASLGELTAGIAHEIQNPLNFVNNFSELSVELIKEIQDERQKTREERDEALEDELLSDLSQNQEKINLHGKRASSIVSGMLEHSKASTGERALTDINKLADEYLRLSYHGMRAKDPLLNANYELITDPDLPKIEVIPQDMGRVLLNLINNAFWAVNLRKLLSNDDSYAPFVSIATQQAPNQIIIKVKDNGIGMPEATKAKVFQPFFTTKPTGQGTGLGLSLAYDIVTKGHGGTIEVETKEGEGTTFVIKLPFQNS